MPSADPMPSVSCCDSEEDSPTPANSLTGNLLARPKSKTFALPRLVTKMFAGLMSRWIIPFSCAASKASAIVDGDFDHPIDGKRALLNQCASDVSPSMNSMAMKVRPPSSAIS